MEKAVIYVAGCPDAYPVEFYNAETGAYEGVIPQLLRRFSQQSDYEVRYYAPGRRDQRQRLARNRQVDMVTCLDGETFPNRRGEAVAAVTAEVDGAPAAYRLCLLDVAPKGLEQALRSFMEQVSEEVRAGELIAAVQTGPPPRQHRLETAGETDQETGLGNRALLARLARQRLSDKNRMLYVMFCFRFDQQRLRGPEDGERTALLQHIASVLQSFSSDADIAARVSDNGFAVLRLCAGREEWELWIAALMERLRECGTCPMAAGVCPLKAEDRELDGAIYRGMQAAGAALERGEAYLLYSDRAAASVQEEKRLQGDVRRGLSSGEFRMEIQFYVDADSGRIVGGEALSRWEHPERGSIPPERFLPMAEREELTDQLDGHNLEEACAFLENIRQHGVEDFFLCCRLSRSAIASPDLAQRCGQVVERYSFRRERLILGLTEGSVARAPQEADRNIRALRELGLKVVLAGAGERFAALFSLGDHLFDGITLGRELLERAESAAGPAVVGGVIRMGHELGVSVLAEDVERVEQVRLLRSLSCDVMRGDQLYHAVPPWEARKKLLEQLKQGRQV